MKRTSRFLIPALACAVAFASCKKSDNTNALPTTYRIDGVSDFEFNPTPGDTMPSAMTTLNIANLARFQEYVKLSLEGLPTGFTYKFSTAAGYPAFTTQLMVTDTNATAGTYPIKLVCEGENTGKRSYNMNLVVKPYPDPIPSALGVWYANACGGNYYTDTVTKYSEANAIMFKNFYGLNANIYAKIDPKRLTVNIPVQQAGGYTYYGNGNIYSNHMYIDVTKVQGVDTSTCTVQLSK